MADKVENILEKMTDELLWYQEESIFTGHQVKKIVKSRRDFEYQLQRKDASISYFLDAIKYERQLERVKSKRKKNLAKESVKHDFRHDNGIKRRIMHLYDRACRKFKQNKLLWKEYLEFLTRTKSLQKLNRTVANALLVHPDTLDFWLIGAYSELDLKGNLFSSRNLMLQALRANENSSKFQLAYLEFEVKYLDKLMQRRDILTGKKTLNESGELVKSGELAFIDEEDQDANVEGEVRKGEEANIVKIVVQNLITKFSADAKVLKEAKRILKRSQQVPAETVMIVSDAYAQLKEVDYAAVLEQLYPLNDNDMCQMDLQKVHKGLTKIDQIKESVQQRKAINFFVDRVTKSLNALIKTKDSDEAVKKETFKTLFELHKKAVQISNSGESEDEKTESELQMLHALFVYAKKVEKKTVLLNYVVEAEQNLCEESRQSIHFKMTADKLSSSEKQLDSAKLQLLEKETNELCAQELKEMVAKSISFEETSLVCFSEKVYVRAKVAILGQMLRLGKKDIALKYLKKVVFSHNRNYRVQSRLLERAAKLMIQGENTLTVAEFTKKVLRDVALEKLTERTFEHLKTCAMIRNLPTSDYCEIYEAKLACSAFMNDCATWVEYHGFLKSSGMHLEAKRVLERAMLAVNDKQAILTQCKQ